MRNTFYLTVLLLGVLLTACGPPADAPAAVAAQTAGARVLPWDRDESVRTARTDLRCGFGESDGTSISVAVSTPEDRATARVSFDLTITYRAGQGDLGLVRVSARPLDGSGASVTLRPESELISSQTLTTTTLRFVSSVPAEGEDYYVGADIGPRCARGRETLLSIRNLIAVGEAYRRN